MSFGICPRCGDSIKNQIGGSVEEVGEIQKHVERYVCGSGHWVIVADSGFPPYVSFNHLR